jgi:chromosome segregation ATPase
MVKEANAGEADAGVSRQGDAAGWDDVLERLGERREAGVSARYAVRSYLSDVMDRIASLDEQEMESWAGLLEDVRALRDETVRLQDRVGCLDGERQEAASRLEKAELELVAAQERASSLEDRAKALEQNGERLREEAKAGDQRMREADARIAAAKEAQRKADQQLNDTLDTLTDLGLAKAELERKVADIEAGFEAVKEERAAAEERWNASDDQRLSQIRLLRKTVEDLERRLEGGDQERVALATCLTQEKETLEQAWKEATSLRETLATVRAEAKDRIEVLELQQEEFIAQLVDDYDAQLAQAREQLEELRKNGVDASLLRQAEMQREEAVQDLERARGQLQASSDAREALASLRQEMEELRASKQAEEPSREQELEAELERVRSELGEARMGVDHLLQDCDRLNAENVRLREAMKQREASAPMALVLGEPDDAGDAVGLMEARASRPGVSPEPVDEPPPAPSTKRSVRTSRRPKQKVSDPVAPSVRGQPEGAKGKRPVGSYFLTAEEVMEETVRDRSKRRGS